MFLYLTWLITRGFHYYHRCREKKKFFKEIKMTFECIFIIIIRHGVIRIQTILLPNKIIYIKERERKRERCGVIHIKSLDDLFFN